MLPCERCGMPNDLESTAWGNLCEDCCIDVHIKNKNKNNKKPVGIKKTKNLDRYFVGSFKCSSCECQIDSMNVSRLDDRDFCQECLKDYINYIDDISSHEYKLEELAQTYRFTGRRVVNTISGRMGVVLKELSSGTVQVMESIQPLVVNSHKGWIHLQIVDEDK